MMSVSPSSRIAIKRKARESNPHHPKVARVSSAARQTVSGCLPKLLSGPEGNRTLLTDLARISRLLGHASPFHSEVRPGIEPGLRPYHRRVLPQHLQTVRFSDHGWNRTIGLLLVTQAS